MSTYLKDYPDENGFFGPYGGMYVPDRLKAEMKKIAEAYYTIGRSFDFVSELRRIRRHFQGRPTPVYYCRNLSKQLGGNIFLKREDLNHSGAHKINHCMGEVMLAKYMGKKRVIAETGAGQHGVAMATAAAYFGLPCDIYMGAVDIAKQHPNVVRMKILGANVIPVTDGQQTLKEAVDAAFEAYLKDPENTLYCIGTVVGPHPFPMMVRDFQKVVGEEAREQYLDMMGELPDAVCACVGGGSNAIGIFCGFLDDPVKLYGVEPLGHGPKPGDNAASLTLGKPGILHGFKSYTLENPDGSAMPVYSVAPSTLGSRTKAAWNTSPPMTPKPSRPSSRSPGPKASSPPSNPPTPSPTPSVTPRSTPTPPSSSTSPVAATRTSITSLSATVSARTSDRSQGKQKGLAFAGGPFCLVVGAAGFEPATICSQSRCATRLRYTP